MTDQYNVTGFFYIEQGYRFRSYLNIRKKALGLGKYLRAIKKRFGPDQPDLMVVMMNPGASSPLSGDDDERAEVTAQPDDTQRQIMKVMAARNFSYARILNLSDLRDPDSAHFMSVIRLLDYAGIHHSIFSPQREQDFSRLFVQSVPVIIAWGAYDRLRPLARRALTRMDNSIQVGQRKVGSEWVYYHARQRGKPPGVWLDEILKQL